ncbi:hypothetical protein ACLOJK_028876 [Asimina triloba]
MASLNIVKTPKYPSRAKGHCILLVEVGWGARTRRRHHLLKPEKAHRDGESTMEIVGSSRREDGFLRWPKMSSVTMIGLMTTKKTSNPRKNPSVAS